MNLNLSAAVHTVPVCCRALLIVVHGSAAGVERYALLLLFSSNLHPLWLRWEPWEMRDCPVLYSAASMGMSLSMGASALLSMGASALVRGKGC